MYNVIYLPFFSKAVGDALLTGSTCSYKRVQIKNKTSKSTTSGSFKKFLLSLNCILVQQERFTTHEGPQYISYFSIICRLSNDLTEHLLKIYSTVILS